MRKIVLNEKDYAAELLRFGNVGKSPLAAAEVLARYYLAQGFGTKQVKELLSQFLAEHWDGYNRVLWDDTLLELVKQARGIPLLDIDSIGVTQRELNRIAEVSEKKLRRLAFALLCLAKYGNAKSTQNNDWVSVKKYKHTGIFRSAKVAGTEKERCHCIKQLRDAGFLEYSKAVDNINLRVLFVDHESPPAAAVRDFENLGYEYRRLCGEPYFECRECGHLSRRHSNAQKYCPACAKILQEKATRKE